MRTLHSYEFRTLLEAQRRSTLAGRGDVKDVDAALERLATGRYGLCLLCGGEIDRSRLKFDPLTERCAACREK